MGMIISDRFKASLGFVEKRLADPSIPFLILIFGL